MSETPLSDASTWNLVAPGYAANSIRHFENYARDALALADVRSGERVLDVATGPGSLALLAHQRGAAVSAIDFSADMLAQFQRRMDDSGTAGVDLQQADGQSLPFEPELFDAGFSMFGLIFFPHRDKGFSELYRVLKPGGRAVVASWHAMDQVEVFGQLFEALYTALPDLPRGQEPLPPLSDPETFAEEMSAVGFDVQVESTCHTMRADNAAEMWAAMRQSFAPIVLLANKMGAAFEPVAAQIEAQLVAKITGEVAIEMPAWLGYGRKPLTRAS